MIISGLPRSGTSMAMKMLDAGGVEIMQDGIRTADDDNPKGYYELEKVKELDKGGDKGWLVEARGKAVKIISFLLKDLPPENRYKILFMRRPIPEVLASQAKMLTNREESSETEDARMTELYEKHLQQVEFFISRRDYLEKLDLPYRSVLDDPRGQAERIRDFLGMDLDVDKMATVADRKLYRNRVEESPSS
ncbi:MAG: sulfotransferase family protein [Gemmatimonadota bacterium]|nr:sulfotransferase family protein [Gemmatimonadota bacterium]MDP6801647.1 sulfotransferase family protein [Gemmatimonadota bacterium]MDP7030806.1 sulfotransferase family protein [Gemmatimonadota bacterium]